MFTFRFTTITKIIVLKAQHSITHLKGVNRGCWSVILKLVILKSRTKASMRWFTFHVFWFFRSKKFKIFFPLHEIICSFTIFACRIQSHISRTPYPLIGGAHAVTGAQNAVPSPLNSPKKASIPQVEILSTRNQWSWGPFERKVLMHCS